MFTLITKIIKDKDRNWAKNYSYEEDTKDYAVSVILDMINILMIGAALLLYYYK